MGINEWHCAAHYWLIDINPSSSLSLRLSSLVVFSSLSRSHSGTLSFSLLIVLNLNTHKTCIWPSRSSRFSFHFYLHRSISHNTTAILACIWFDSDSVVRFGVFSFITLTLSYVSLFVSDLNYSPLHFMFFSSACNHFQLIKRFFHTSFSINLCLQLKLRVCLSRINALFR